MYKTLKLDLQKKFELDEFYFVEIVPTAWLPQAKSMVLTNLFAESSLASMSNEEVAKLQSVAEGGTTDLEAIRAQVKDAQKNWEFLAKAVSIVVVAWNLIDDEGQPLPVPSRFENDMDMFKSMSNIPMAMLSYIFEVANADELTDIPLVKKNQQEQRSSGQTPELQPLQLVPQLVEQPQS